MKKGVDQFVKKYLIIQGRDGKVKETFSWRKIMSDINKRKIKGLWILTFSQRL